MLRIAALSCVLVLLLTGCKIEESAQGVSGSVYVTLTDSAGAPVERATIWVDGHEIPQRTPATVSGLSLGVHIIGAVRPDTYEVYDTVDVLFNATVNLTLSTTYRPVGPVELVSAPDNTVLLLDYLPFGATPPSVLYVPIGTHHASLYLAGHATDLPARWTLTVAQNDTFQLSVGFTPVETGDQPGLLSPVWALPDDLDSSIFRLQDYRGQVLLLTFFYADCAPCIAEMPAIQAVYTDTEYAGRIQFFGIDPNDSYFTFSQFRNIYHPELGLTFPLVHDLGQVVRTSYGVTQFPSNFIIDQTGKVRFRFGGITITTLREAIETLLAETP